MKTRILGALLFGAGSCASAPPVGRALSPSPSTTAVCRGQAVRNLSDEGRGLPGGQVSAASDVS